MDTLVRGSKNPSPPQSKITEATYLISSIRIEGLQVLRSFINQSLLPVAWGKHSHPTEVPSRQKYDQLVSLK